MIEYLYVDTRRLDSYFEQISSTPVAYDKLPHWKVGLALAGPSIEGMQHGHARPFTTHEKLTKLEEHLATTDALADLGADCPVSWRASQLFRRATFDAHVMHLPLLVRRRADTAWKPDALKIWLWESRSSESEGEAAALVLLQDYRGTEDSFCAHPNGISSQSALYLFISELNDQLDAEHPLGTEQPPTEFLRGLGAVSLSPRRIRSTFRLRSEVRHYGRFVQVGYPISVEAID